jgi:hypothetical protein
MLDETGDFSMMRRLASNRPVGRATLSLLLFSMCTVMAPDEVRASDEFPVELQKASAFACVPACITCHTTEPGTERTATQPFAVAMQAHGLTAGEPESVQPAYDAVVAEQALLPEDDPNKLDLNFPCEADVLYGCGAHVAPRPLDTTWAWILSLVSVSAWVFTRRRRARSE